MAEIICLPTGTAKALKPHSQPAQKYAENSGIALVMKSAPMSQAGSVSSLLGALQYGFAGAGGAALALAYVAVLHHRMAEIGKTALLPVGFAEQARILVRRRDVRRVQPLGRAEIRLPVAAWRRRLPEPSLGRKLFIEAQAFSKVPSTEKCSAHKSPFTSGRASGEDRNPCAIACVSKRSRFFENVDASKTPSSIESPTNQRNRMSNSILSTNCRSERIV
jgi:hypothetical protein